MSQGLDANQDLRNKIGALQAAGIKWVARYINPKADPLTAGEAAALRAAGIWIVSVWEYGSPTSADYFTAERGQQHGLMALDRARSVGQPEDGVIYATVDYDAEEDDLPGIIAYFKAMRAALIGSYTLGVYGSGRVCRVLSEQGLVNKTWLTQSTGFAEYDSWKPHATIVQGRETMLAGVDVDLDTSNGAAGGW